MFSDRGVMVDLAAGEATGNGRGTLIGIQRAEGSEFDDSLRDDHLDNGL